MSSVSPKNCTVCGRFVGHDGEFNVVWPNGSQPDERMEAFCKDHMSQPKIYPPLAGPTEEDYHRAADELFPQGNHGEVFTDEQRRMILQRARELYMARQTVC